MFHHQSSSFLMQTLVQQFFNSSIYLKKFCSLMMFFGANRSRAAMINIKAMMMGLI
jgi:hypothetical protein